MPLDLSDIVTKLDSATLTRLFYDQSFVLKEPDGRPLKEGTDLVSAFRLGPGGWIVLAKATLRALSPDAGDWQLRLSVEENAHVDEDRSLASVHSLGYATVSLMLGTHLVNGAIVKLEAQGQLGRADISWVVITAIKTEKLIVGSL